MTLSYVANPVVVLARRIVRVVGTTTDNRNNVFELEDGGEFHADEGMISRFPDAGPGDYVVEQEDGYVYLNPKGVFERKYQPLYSAPAPDDVFSMPPPEDRVTGDDIAARIASVEYIRIGKTTTICFITLDNGFSVIGESACVEPANFNQETGRVIAYGKAFEKLWPLFGFLLAEKRHRAATG